MINKIHTPCKDCVFAVYNGKLQKSCRLGKLDKYKERNAEIIEVYDEDEYEFFVINDRYCPTFRHQKSWGHKTQQEQDLDIAHASQIKIAIIVLITGSYNNIDKTIQSIEKQSVKPHQVFFVNVKSGYKMAELNAELMSKIGNNFTWRIVTQKEINTDLVFGHIKSHYYSIIYAGREFADNYFESLNFAVNHELYRIFMVEGENQQTFNSTIHKALDGNKSLTLEDEDGKFIYLTDLKSKIIHYNQQEKSIWKETDVISISNCGDTMSQS